MLTFTLVLKYVEYGLSHDELHASTQILRQHLWTEKGSTLFWRQPTVFGPLPGPRQNSFGRISTQPVRSATATKTVIKFKTSATLLRNMFPNDRYCFEKPDTVATASFSLEALEHLEWLGGRGYDLFALYIHGVVYKLADGQTVKGTYCPIMFENQTDPILTGMAFRTTFWPSCLTQTGREELGFPKLFSDIGISRGENWCKATLTWRGQSWGEVKIGDLQTDTLTNGHVPTTSQDVGDGLFVHKYVPSSGTKQRGQRDAEYDVFLPFRPEASSLQSRRVASASNIRLSIRTFDEWKNMPTLQLPINRLAEIPVFEFIEGVESIHKGVPDFSDAQQLN